MSIIKQSPPKVRRGVIVALAVLGSSLSLAAPSQAQAAEYEFQPVRLIAHDTEDGWPDQRDEWSIYYGGGHWVGLVQNHGTVGSEELPPARFTGSQMRIDLKERDNGWHDSNNLGEAYVHAEATGEEKSVHFGAPGGWWYYELVYRVVQVA